MTTTAGWTKAALVFGGIVALNGLGFVAYMATRSETAPEGEAKPAQGDVSEAARQAKFEGLDAIERGDYEAAIRAFTRAVREGDESPELLRLLTLAQDLKHKYGASGGTPAGAGVGAGEAAAAAAAAAGAAAMPGEARKDPAEAPAAAAQIPSPELEKLREAVATARRRWTQPPRRRAARRPARGGGSGASRGTVEAPTPVEPAPEPRPLEPAAAPEQPAAEAAPEAEQAETAPPEPPPDPSQPAAAPAAEPPPPPPSPPPRPVAERRSPPPSPPPRREPSTRPAPRPTAVGILEVVSPNVYGEVWVNGQRRGYPPIVLRDVPAGRVRVEIRVDGQVRRSKLVRVREGRRTKVRLW